MLMLNSQASAIFSIQSGAEMLFDSMIHFFEDTGVCDLCYMAKETQTKPSLGIMHSPFSYKSLHIVDDVYVHTQRHREIYT